MSKMLVTIAFAFSLSGCLNNKSNVEVNFLAIAKKPAAAMAPTYTQQNSAKKSITYSKQTQMKINDPAAASSVAGFSQTSTTLSTVQPGYLDNISLDLDLSQSSNRFSEEQVEAEKSTDLEIALSKTLASKNKVAVAVGVSHDELGKNETTVGDTTISYSLKSKQLSRDNSVVYSARAVLPTSENSQEVTKLQAAGSLRAALTSKKQLAGKPLTLVTFVDGLKYSHKFIRKADGESLMDYRVRVYGAASIDLTEKVSIGVEGYYQAGHTYQSTMKANFLISEELAYTPKKDGASIYLAHTNDGNALGPNGEDSNIKAFDSSTSILSAGVRSSF